MSHKSITLAKPLCSGIQRKKDRIFPCQGKRVLLTKSTDPRRDVMSQLGRASDPDGQDLGWLAQRVQCRDCQLSSGLLKWEWEWEYPKGSLVQPPAPSHLSTLRNLIPYSHCCHAPTLPHPLPPPSASASLPLLPLLHSTICRAPYLVRASHPHPLSLLLSVLLPCPLDALWSLKCLYQH